MKEQEIVERVIKAINKNPRDGVNLAKRIGRCHDYLMAAEVALQDLDTFIKTRYPDFGGAPGYAIDTEDWFRTNQALLTTINENLDTLDDNFLSYFGK